MSRADWLYKYPRVAALMQQETDILEDVSQENLATLDIPEVTWTAVSETDDTGLEQEATAFQNGVHRIVQTRGGRCPSRLEPVEE